MPIKELWRRTHPLFKLILSLGALVSAIVAILTGYAAGKTQVITTLDNEIDNRITVQLAPVQSMLQYMIASDSSQKDYNAWLAKTNCQTDLVHGITCK